MSAQNAITQKSSSKPARKPRKPKIKPKWAFVPWSQRGEAHGPVFASLIYEFLQRPRSDFQKDPTTGKFSKFLENDMPMSHWIVARLLVSAAQGDLSATREILDRTDGRVMLPKPDAPANNNNGKSGPMVVQIVYDKPTPRELEWERRKMERERADELRDMGKSDRIHDVAPRLGE